MKVKIIGLALTISVVFFAIVCCMVLLLSCNTEKKLTAKAEKFVDKYPKKALPVFRGKFPCIETKSDTTIFLTDTTFYVDCPDTIKAAEYFTIHDTVLIHGKTIIRDGKTIKVPVTLPQKIVTIETRVKDSSEVKEVMVYLGEANKKIKKLEDKVIWLKWFSFWMILFGFSIRYIIKGVQYLTLKKLPK